VEERRGEGREGVGRVGEKIKEEGRWDGEGMDGSEDAGREGHMLDGGSDAHRRMVEEGRCRWEIERKMYGEREG
jgi:hypothetical protein